MPLEYLSRLMSMAKKSGAPRILAVAAADDKVCLETVVVAREEELVLPVLFGDQDRISGLLRELGQDPGSYQISHCADTTEAVQKSVAAVAGKEAHLIMKGKVQTGDLFQVYFEKQWDLRLPGRLMSHVGLFDVPGREGLFAITDAALNIEPNQDRLLGIIRNAIELMNRFGWDHPKVALLAATSKVNSRQPVTVKVQEVARRAEKEFPQATVFGPLALDEAINPKAVSIKETAGPIQGDADIMVVPTLEVGNVFYKTLTAFAHAKVVGAVMGGRAPVVITSRSDSEETKLGSLAISCLLVNEG
jgi:phosphate butyryltransferase